MGDILLSQFKCGVARMGGDRFEADTKGRGRCSRYTGPQGWSNGLIISYLTVCCMPETDSHPSSRSGETLSYFSGRNFSR